MTIGKGYYYKNKYDDLEVDYYRLLDQYGRQQASLEAYARAFGHIIKIKPRE